jgi:ATP-dependent RNA helicase RhlE
VTTTPTDSRLLSFSDFALLDTLQKNLASEGYTIPTPIQAQAIPALLSGNDMLGCAQTGTGKTAAFALPILDRLARTPRKEGSRGMRALVLLPTRELAVQVGESFRTYGRGLRITGATVFGGVGQGPQVDAIRRGVDVVVATPGRLIDLMDQGHVRFDDVEVLVLDEADRMLDMGFIKPIRQILAKLPRRRQNMLFSATMPPDIAELAGSILVNPEKVAVAPIATPAETVAQWVLHVAKEHKRALMQRLLEDSAMSRVVVFTRTKHGANRVAENIARTGVSADAIHGNKSQNARQRALQGFRDGRLRVLVATDLAARGLDIDGITHVVNYELPNEPESYVHRIGRTGRAGAKGIALSFCDHEERAYLRDIERLTRRRLQVSESHPFVDSAAGPASPRSSDDGDRPRGGRGSFGRPRPGGGGRGPGARQRSAPSNPRTPTGP